MGPRKLTTGDGYFIGTRREVKRGATRQKSKRKSDTQPSGGGLAAGEYTISGGGSWQ
jgi:hypothetical protein